MFHLFAGEFFYPHPFLGDYRGSFSTKEEAVQWMEEAMDRFGSKEEFDWWAIAQEQNGKLVVVDKCTSIDPLR